MLRYVKLLEKKWAEETPEKSRKPGRCCADIIQTKNFECREMGRNAEECRYIPQFLVLQIICKQCSLKKSTPTKGLLTSARANFQLKYFLRPKLREQVWDPNVEMRVPFVPLRGSPFFCVWWSHCCGWQHAKFSTQINQVTLARGEVINKKKTTNVHWSNGRIEGDISQHGPGWLALVSTFFKSGMVPAEGWWSNRSTGCLCLHLKINFWSERCNCVSRGRNLRIVGEWISGVTVMRMSTKVPSS